MAAVIDDGMVRFIINGPHVSLTLVFASLYYILLGSTLDVVFAALFMSQRFPHALSFLFARLWNAMPKLIPVPAAIGTSYLLLSMLDRTDARWGGPAQPYLLPCKTTHSRTFPKKHSFGYSYLAVGVPVGSSGTFNRMLSVDDKSARPGKLLSMLFRGGWYNVNASDYLQRGDDDGGLRGKLDAYLKSQDIDPCDYPHAYLVTAARFLGYHFNPVSFWYLYSPEKILSAVILEVNNTFDERRPYLVLRDFSAEAEVLGGPTRKSLPSSRVTGSWPKDFHVSPFNSRKGSYSLLARDPLGPGMEGFQGIDVTINLRSSKGNAKLVARLFSEGTAVQVGSLGILSKARFLLSWSWIGFATFPRILREAAALFFQRRLHVWYRPEPLKESLGRRANDIERDLELAFRSYLRHLVSKSPARLLVKYTPSGGTSAAEEMRSALAQEERSRETQALELTVLTPLFYSRFVHYAHDLEGIHTELTRYGTLWVDEPHLLPDIFPERGSPTPVARTAMDRLCFETIRVLRRRPAAIPTASTSADGITASPLVDIRHLGISPMDAYMLERAGPRLKASYRSALLRLFLADRYLMGSTALLGLCIAALRISIAWASVAALSQAIGTA